MSQADIEPGNEFIGPDLNVRYTIGRHTYGRPLLLAWDNSTELHMGSFCSIGQGTKFIMGGEHHTDWVCNYPFNVFWMNARDIKGNPTTKGDIIVGNEVWFGVEAVVLSGVHIGHGAVVGARSVVTKNVPPYGIVAGNPARLIRKRFDEETIAKLLAISWWDWDDMKIVEFTPLLLSGDVDRFIKAATST